MDLLYDIGLGLYGIAWLACARLLAGHWAWGIHTSAKTRRGIKPEPEDWVVSMTFALIIGCLWPLALLVYRSPRILKSESEREAEKLSDQIKLKRLALDNERRIKELTCPEEDS